MTTTAPTQQKTPRAGGISTAHAVLVEILAVLASVAVGHLVAGLVSPTSSPFQAVADAVVRYSPEALTEFGKSLDFPAIGLPKGVADKVLLLVGIAVVLLVVGLVAAPLARRSRRSGRMVIIVLGLIALAAVVSSPVFGALDLLAPLAALLAGTSVYFRLYNLAQSAAGSDGAVGSGTAGSGGAVAPDNVVVPARAGDGTADPASAPDLGHAPRTGWQPNPEVSRRNLMVASAAIGAGAIGAGVVGQLSGAGTDVVADRTEVAPRLRPSRPAPPIPAGADFVAQGTPTYITSNRDFYRIDTALRIPVLTTQNYRLRLHGMLDRELTLTYDDLVKRPLEERVVTLTCVSNLVNGDLISNASFVGVSLRDLLLEAGVRPGADQLFSTSADGWTCGTPTDVILEPDRGAMLVVAMNGVPLPLEHGYPVRMVVPGLYGFVSATKWLTDLEVTRFDRRRAYWLERGWAQQAPIKTQSRIDRPRGLDSVPAGRFTAAGIAWAQHRGVSRVEVRLDGGPWQEAQLSSEVSRDTWRMWRAELTVSPGNHFLESRASDGSGAVQIEQRTEPIPDGASGWPLINFTAR